MWSFSIFWNSRSSHTTTETTKKVVIVHTYYNFFSQPQGFFQQFYVWATIFTIFFGKIVVKIVVMCEGLYFWKSWCMNNGDSCNNPGGVILGRGIFNILACHSAYIIQGLFQSHDELMMSHVTMIAYLWNLFNISIFQATDQDQQPILLATVRGNNG